VAASADYRLGWNPFDPDEVVRRWALVNAMYRSIQDARTAIRFFKGTAAELGNPFGIDLNKIVLWGQGTGGYISLNAMILDDYNKALIPKFLLPGGGPMISEQVSGDIYGTSVGVVPPGYPIFTPGRYVVLPKSHRIRFRLPIDGEPRRGHGRFILARPGTYSSHLVSSNFRPNL
ncbi:MAG: hypothetical protein ACE5FF_09660, partial [Saprospiraceae bacterium]